MVENPRIGDRGVEVRTGDPPLAARRYQRKWLPADIFAGLTVAAITVPEDMGYARMRPVLTGFLAGVGIQIALGQLPGMLGIKASGGFFDVVADIVRGIPDANRTSVTIAVAVVVLIVVLERVSKRVPAMLLATVLAIAAVEAFDLGARGVDLVGSVPAGFPPFGLPSASLGDIPSLIPIALAVAFVVLAQATATSQSFAAKNGYSVDSNRDLVALGIANIGSGVSERFPVNGSVSRTAASPTEPADEPGRVAGERRPDRRRPAVRHRPPSRKCRFPHWSRSRSWACSTGS